LAAAPVQAQNLISNFTAQALGESSVKLEWNSGGESGLASFRVERSLDGVTFTPLATLQPQGSNSPYSYLDNNIYKSSNRTYYYRIRAQMTDNSFSFSPIQTVTLFFSGIQQTWGSIKALFR
jgi:hypothetical protein